MWSVNLDYLKVPSTVKSLLEKLHNEEILANGLRTIVLIVKSEQSTIIVVTVLYPTLHYCRQQFSVSARSAKYLYF